MLNQKESKSDAIIHHFSQGRREREREREREKERGRETGNWRERERRRQRKAQALSSRLTAPHNYLKLTKVEPNFLQRLFAKKIIFFSIHLHISMCECVCKYIHITDQMGAKIKLDYICFLTASINAKNYCLCFYFGTTILQIFYRNDVCMMIV